MTTQGKAPVVMIALDSFEHDVAKEMMDDGKLTHLRRLREQNGLRKIDSTEGSHFPGAVWPSFYAGQPVEEHGVYHPLFWNADRMRFEDVRRTHFHGIPFWKRLQDGTSCALVNNPVQIGSPEVPDGILLSGWATHDQFRLDSYPDHLRSDLEAKFGEPIMPDEAWEQRPVSDLLSLRDQLIDATEQLTDVTLDLYGRRDWDVFFVNYGPAHRAGHYLWNDDFVDDQQIESTVKQEFDTALEAVYQATDQALGRLLNAFPDPSKQFIFSLHGITDNPGWQYRLEDFLNRIQQGETSSAAGKRPGLLGTVKQILPESWKENVLDTLPSTIRGSLASYWYEQVFDWENTDVLKLSGDQVGYVRVNLRGRENKGIVAPGQEYDSLLNEVEEGLRSFRDVRTGKPVVEEVRRVDEFTASDAPHTDQLPDLCVFWNHDVPACKTPEVYSDDLGQIKWDSHDGYHSGRCGSHKSDGWMVTNQVETSREPVQSELDVSEVAEYALQGYLTSSTVLK